MPKRLDSTRSYWLSLSPLKQVIACKSELHFTYAGTSNQFMDNASLPSVSFTNDSAPCYCTYKREIELGLFAALPTSPQLASAALAPGVEGFYAAARRLEIDHSQ